MNIFRDEEFSFTMYKTKTKACYLSQPYFWEQQSSVERSFGKFRETEQNRTELLLREPQRTIKTTPLCF